LAAPNVFRSYETGFPRTCHPGEFIHTETLLSRDPPDRMSTAACFTTFSASSTAGCGREEEGLPFSVVRQVKLNSPARPRLAQPPLPLPLFFSLIRIGAPQLPLPLRVRALARKLNSGQPMVLNFFVLLSPSFSRTHITQKCRGLRAPPSDARDQAAISFRFLHTRPLLRIACNCC